jgi:ABC-type antimicrobial peptide transport system permease subunit
MIRDSVSGLLGAPYPARLIAALALVFGLYPAIRASRLSPMEAMR